jgi:hypothetical protein
VRESDDDTLSGADEGAELVLRLGQPARRERGRCASKENG